jgi:hypothetical protein
MVRSLWPLYPDALTLPFPPHEQLLVAVYVGNSCRDARRVLLPEAP